MKGRARIQVSGNLPELAELDFTDGLGGTGPSGGRLKEVPPPPLQWHLAVSPCRRPAKHYVQRQRQTQLGAKTF